jgi:hypothetical protein
MEGEKYGGHKNEKSSEAGDSVVLLDFVEP